MRADDEEGATLMGSKYFKVVTDCWVNNTTGGYTQLPIEKCWSETFEANDPGDAVLQFRLKYPAVQIREVMELDPTPWDKIYTPLSNAEQQQKAFEAFMNRKIPPEFLLPDLRYDYTDAAKIFVEQQKSKK